MENKELKILITDNIDGLNTSMFKVDNIINIETIGFWFWKRYRVFYINRW